MMGSVADRQQALRAAMSIWEPRTLHAVLDDAAEAIRHRAEAGAADGFIALPGGAMQSLDLFVEEVMPRLAAMGLGLPAAVPAGR